MTAIPNRPAARWLPSRSHYAIFRLIGFLLSRNACDQPPQSGILALHSAQNTPENVSVSIFTMSAIAWYLALAIERLLILPAAIVLGIVLAPLAAQIPIYFSGAVLLPLWRRMTGSNDANNLTFNSVMLMTIVFALAAFFALRGGWTHYFGITWLGIGCVNAICAVIMLILRNRVRELERRCGA